jgi:hypothetical protein
VAAFTRRVFELAARYKAKTFAGIVGVNAPRHAEPSYLRKDYAYLFERFYYYMEAVSAEEMGLVVFDELEKAQSRILLGQLENTFWNRKRVMSEAPALCLSHFLSTAT